MKDIAKMIDHTLLKPAKKSQIEQLCNEAKQYGFASVCIQPCYVKLASKLLCGSDVAVCTVIGFPMGENTVNTKVYETKKAVKDGATEIDMVINQSYAKSNAWKNVEKEISAVVKAAGGNLVKVIIETCNLTPDQIVKACRSAISAKANYVKTSTGYGTAGAKVEDVALMYKTVHESGLKVKASGGIRSGEDAKKMIEAGAERIGTSAGIAIFENR